MRFVLGKSWAGGVSGTCVPRNAFYGFTSQGSNKNLYMESSGRKNSGDVVGTLVESTCGGRKAPPPFSVIGNLQHLRFHRQRRIIGALSGETCALIAQPGAVTEKRGFYRWLS
jgi:hypothetical protein